MRMFWQWLENFLHRWNGEWDPQKILIAVLASGLALVLIRVLVAMLKWGWRHIRELIEARRRIKHALWAVSENSPGLWLSTPPNKGYPADYISRMATSIPIMTVANLKGGVGKTTVAANLAAHYAYYGKRRDGTLGERVLFIDLDFQGSSSAMMLPENQRPDVAARLIEGGGKDILIHQADPLRLEWRPNGIQPDARGIPADYSLARADNRVMVRWLLKDYEGKGDARYWLANALLDPEVQAWYDRVIIDAPPRIVAGKVQALCASTHVLIPTILDRLCTEAASRFANQLHEEKELWPSLKIAGVTAVRCRTPQHIIAEREAIRGLIDALERHPWRPQLFWNNAFIRQDTLLSQAAGQYSVYGTDSDNMAHENVRAMFSNLAKAIEGGLKGTRTYEAWEAWLRNQNNHPAAGAARGNGFSENDQAPLRPV